MSEEKAMGGRTFEVIVIGAGPAGEVLAGRGHDVAVVEVELVGAGRAYYERKLAEGQTPKEALRSLKRRLSDVIFARLQTDARRTAASPR